MPKTPAAAQSPFLEKQVPDRPVSGTALGEGPEIQVGASAQLIQCHLFLLS